jgi:hypothetical protein
MKNGGGQACGPHNEQLLIIIDRLSPPRAECLRGQHREYRGAHGESRRMDEMQMGYHRSLLMSH